MFLALQMPLKRAGKQKRSRKTRRWETNAGVDAGHYSSVAMVNHTHFSGKAFFKLIKFGPESNFLNFNDPPCAGGFAHGERHAHRGKPVAQRDGGFFVF